MAAVFESDEPISSVQIDGLAVLKIVKHCQESLPTLVTGSLLGLVVEGGVMEITHAFPFPEPRDDSKSDLVKTSDPSGPDDEAAALDGHEFQLEMMKMLREVNVDNNCVGWYQSMYLGTHSTSALLENQLSYQTDLSANAVVVLYDPIQTGHGNLMLKCFRLTSEAIALKASRKNSYLDPSQIFEEVPMSIKNPALARGLLHSISDGKYRDHDGGSYGADTTFDRLNLSTAPYMEKHLEFLCNWVDDLTSEQNKFQYYTRGLNRERKNDKKRSGNRGGKSDADDAVTAAAWESDEAPRRLESLLISNQIRNYCDQVEKYAGSGFGKLFLAGGLHKEDSKAVS